MKLTKLVELINKKEITISKNGKIRKHPKSKLSDLGIALYLYDQRIYDDIRCVICEKPVINPFSLSEWKLKVICDNKHCQIKHMLQKRKQKSLKLPIGLKTKFGRLKWLLQNGCFDKNKNVKTSCLETLGISIKELYDWVNDIKNTPKCIVCNKNDVSFHSWKKGYNKICSNKLCQIKYNKQILKFKYGTSQPNLIKEVKEKILINQRRKQFQHLKELLLVRNIEILDNVEKFVRYQYDTQYNLICIECNTKFKDKLHPQILPWCPKCGKLNYGSKLEQIVKDWLDERNIEYVRHYRINKKFEADFYVPKLNIAIEVNGLYYHFGYHDKSKSLYLSKLSIPLLHLYEDTIIFEPSKAKAILYSKLNVYDYILYARNVDVVQISQRVANEFHRRYHLSGHSKSHISFGLIYKDNLLSVISYKLLNNKAIIDRYTIKPFVKIIGGFGKILKHSMPILINKYDIVQVDTYLHLELNNIPEKSVYYRYGFDLRGLNEDFYVIYNNRRYHRLFANKQNLLKLANEKGIEVNDVMTQEELMRLLDIKTLHLGSWKFTKKITDF